MTGADPFACVRRVVDRWIEEIPSGELETDQAVATKAAFRIDAVDSSSARFVDLAKDFGVLLSSCSAADVLLLADVVAESGRLLQVLDKYFEGTLTRTSFLSYVADQQFESMVKARLGILDDLGLRELRLALSGADPRKLRAILLANASEPNH